MWNVVGILYIIIGPTVVQITGTKKFTSPQECFAEAMTVMANKDNPNNMACVPIPIEGT